MWSWRGRGRTSKYLRGYLGRYLLQRFWQKRYLQEWCGGWYCETLGYSVLGLMDYQIKVGTYVPVTGTKFSGQQ